MFTRIPSVFGQCWPGDGIEGIAITIISRDYIWLRGGNPCGGVNLGVPTLGTVMITRHWALADDLGGIGRITAVFHLDLAIVADETRETITVVA